MTGAFPEDVTYVVVPEAPGKPECFMSPDTASFWVRSYEEKGIHAVLVRLPGYYPKVPPALSFLDRSGAP